MKKRWLGLALVVILGVGLGLRLHGYTTDPTQRANFDGVNWAWNGQSLILEHVPEGWSYLPSYHQVVAVRVEGTTYLPGVAPDFDHPPLFGLLVGGVVLIAGERTPDSLTEGVMRLVPIALSLLTILLSYALVRRMTGSRWIGLVTAAVLAVAPPVVVASRLVESEALLTPLLLAGLILALRIRDGAGRWSAAALAMVCLMAPLVKEPGVIVAVIATVILLCSSHRRTALIPLAGLAGGVGLYLLFAAAIDWHAFTATVLAQGARRSSLWGAAVNYFGSREAGLGGFVPLVDPVWFVGWPVLAGLALRRRQWRPVALAALLYAATIILLGDGRAIKWSGWYRFPDEPLLYAAVVVAGCGLLRSAWTLVAPLRSMMPPPALCWLTGGHRFLYVAAGATECIKCHEQWSIGGAKGYHWDVASSGTRARSAHRHGGGPR